MLFRAFLFKVSMIGGQGWGFDKKADYYCVATAMLNFTMFKVSDGTFVYCQYNVKLICQNKPYQK